MPERKKQGGGDKKAEEEAPKAVRPNIGRLEKEGNKRPMEFREDRDRRR